MDFKNLTQHFEEDVRSRATARKLKFNQQMYGDDEMLKEIQKIASKHAKNVDILGKIREEEKLLGVPLMERRLLKLKRIRVSSKSQLKPDHEWHEKDQKQAAHSSNRNLDQILTGK